MKTYFAPAQRTDRRKFKNQIADISHSPIMDSLLKSAGGLLVVLNEDRQIVALNHAFLKELGIRDIEDVLGFRLGESLDCIHAHDKPNGCGTTEHCPSCGAAIAMMSAITKNQIAEETCFLQSEKNGRLQDLCLSIRAVPLHIENNRWILIYAHDITQQQFWANLERVFFHDINNTLTGVYGNVQLLQAKPGCTKEIASVKTGIERLIREIQMQKALSNRKLHDFQITLTETGLEEVRQELHLIMDSHRSIIGKQFIESWPAGNHTLKTDLLLLTRVLANILINAFEATPESGIVRLTAQKEGSLIHWDIWNRDFIAPEIQKRIFQRHFSTKPQAGRGLGTYSIRLFTREYLNGKVSFTSSETGGTTFRVSLPLG